MYRSEVDTILINQEENIEYFKQKSDFISLVYDRISRISQLKNTSTRKSPDIVTYSSESKANR